MSLQDRVRSDGISHQDDVPRTRAFEATKAPLKCWERQHGHFRSPGRRLCGNSRCAIVRRVSGLSLSWLGKPPAVDDQEGFSTVRNATLTLLGLIIGFSFSMAVTRYDQRKNYEEAEANAIGTEYVRADLLPAEDAGKVRKLLIRY